MDATVSTKELRDALRTLKTFVGRSSGAKVMDMAAITTNADGGSVTVRRWNFTDATASIAATSGPIEAGSVHVNADALANAIGKGKGSVRLTLEGDRLTVISDTGIATVKADVSGDVLPAAYAERYAPYATIQNGEREHLRSVARAAAKGTDARAVLTSVAIRANGNGSGEASATDTYRLHVAKLGDVRGDADTVRIFPAHVIATATKTATALVVLNVSEDGKHFSTYFLTEGGTKNARRVTYYNVGGMTVEGPYPNYRSLIPDADSAAARWSISDAAGTADVLAAFRNNENAAAVMTPSGSAVAISATFRDGSKRDGIAPMVPDGDAIGLDAFVAFNPSYFAEAVKHAGNGATVNLRDSLKSALIEGDHGYALVMPMRVR